MWTRSAEKTAATIKKRKDIMRKWLFLLVGLTMAVTGQSQDYADHRNDIWATTGTDFWFCAPRTYDALSANTTTLCVTAEHFCTVTVEVPMMGYRQDYEVQPHTYVNVRMDTVNFLEVPEQYVRYIDTLSPGVPTTSQPGYGPQNKAIHVSSTDTISVAMLVRAMGTMDVVQLLPTEMLRDEYVIQSYPEANCLDGCFFDVVATEDSTVVEVVLSEDDWMGHHAGDTLRVMLMRGQMWHEGAKDPSTCHIDSLFTHSFVPTKEAYIVDVADLSGTRVRALDGKRIAVIAGHNSILIPFCWFLGGTPNADMAIEMALPTAYAGKSFIIPNLQYSRDDYIRITTLGEGTTVTIVDDSRLSGRMRTLRMNAYETQWFQLSEGEGPFVITTTEPVQIAVFSMGSRYSLGYWGDPAMLIVKPTEWWSSNPINYHTPFYVDNNHNIYAGHFETHLICRTADVPYMRIDDYSVSQFFNVIGGTPFSYAYFDRNSQFNSLGLHHIYCTREGYFMAFCQQFKDQIHALWTLPHKQPGGCYLTVNGIAADQVKRDSMWCLYDTLVLRGWSERPADSIEWDLGDGTRLSLAYDQGQEVRHLYQDTGRYEVRRIIRWRDESKDVYVGGKEYFTRTPDTMSVSLWIKNRIDTSIFVRLCEGGYYFHGVEYFHVDTLFYDTTYWTQSGCDTLWAIDLVTCPHCSFISDTIGLEQLPWTFNGVTFGGEQTSYPIYIGINDSCDSIIYYTLVVDKHWGEVIDSVIIMVPNVFTPGREDNNRFKVVANRFINELKVWIYDRQGVLIKEFDGLTDDWDGTKDGRPLKQGTYVYYIRYIDTKVNGWKTLKGTVTLLR